MRTRNTSFWSTFWGEKPFMHWYRITSCLHFMHCIASCGYSLTLVDLAARVPLNLRIVLQSASVAKMSTITSCIVKSATTLQCTVNQSYYLLEPVGGFFLDITNPRKWFFIWTFFLKLNRHSYFRHTVSFKNNSVPTTPRFVWWRCNKTRCSIYTSAGIDAHRGKSSAPKAQSMDLKKAHSSYERHEYACTSRLA